MKLRCRTIPGAAGEGKSVEDKIERILIGESYVIKDKATGKPTLIIKEYQYKEIAQCLSNLFKPKVNKGE